MIHDVDARRQKRRCRFLGRQREYNASTGTGDELSPEQLARYFDVFEFAFPERLARVVYLYEPQDSPALRRSCCVFRTDGRYAGEYITSRHCDRSQKYVDRPPVQIAHCLAPA